GQSLLAFRVAAASDIRDGDVPPLAQWTRPVAFALPLPDKPAGPGWVGTVDARVAFQQNAELSTGMLDEHRMQLTVTCLGRDDGGPGMLTAEVATSWRQAVAQLAFGPDHLSFGNVAVRDASERTLHLQSVGDVDLVVTINGPAPHSPFRWDQVTAATVAPGA